jgi:GT2 family glycosyltransferase/glycosyltransferase involved in cell wall biosynthesis
VNQTPLVSIVIPAFNPRFFNMALQSALSQTYENLEIVICDDCPTGEIKQILEASANQSSVSLHYLRNPERLGFQRNVLRCVEEAQGEFVKVLCDDDRLFAHCIARQVEVMVEHADVNLVFGHRLFADAGNFILPSRVENCIYAPADAVFKGGDLLAILESSPLNFLGNFSAALMRRADALTWLPVLSQTGSGFVALLDFALFVCLLRRGNMAVITSPLSIERLYPERLTKQAETRRAAMLELSWLKQMLTVRSGDPAPAAGWVRYITLTDSRKSQARDWKECNLRLAVVGRQTRVQARVGGDSESYAEFYNQWLGCRKLSVAQRKNLPQQVAGWPRKPAIVPVVIDPQGDSAALNVTLSSLVNQLYEPLAVLLLSAAQGVTDPRILQVPFELDWPKHLNGLLPSLEGADWFYVLRTGDRVAESALLILAERIAAMPDIRCVYSDEGALVDGESTEPVFKPDFNLDLMRSYPYVGRPLAFERQIFIELGGFGAGHGELAPHDLLWRLVENVGPQAIEHIAEIQVESAFTFAQWLSLPEVIEGNASLLGAHLERLGVEHQTRPDELPLINRTHYLHATRPLVSIIIQAGDDLLALQRCTEGVIEKTAYSNYEILIVDNAGDDPEMRLWLEAMAQLGASMLRVLKHRAPTNDAALNNFAASQARGEYVLLLSHYSVVHQSDWLDEMLAQAQRPEVGVVGARLTDAQNNIVHAGVVLGMYGLAGRPFASESAQARGYMQRLQVVQNWSAVSGDCLMVRKQVFDSVGGLDEVAFELEGSDLDLCLRVGRNGYLVVWTPHASLIMSPKNASAEQPQEVERRELETATFYQRWLPSIARDPGYNPSLSLRNSGFALEPGLRSGWNPFFTRSIPYVLGLPINNTAVGHYRVTHPFAELEVAGRITGRISHELPSLIEIERMSPDVIVLQCRYSEHDSKDISRLKKYSQALRIFELDDYIVSAPKKNSHTRNKPANIEELLRRGIALCDRLVVTTPALADTLSSMHDDIRVVPNMLAVDPWAGLRSRRGTSCKPRVGWGGGTSHTGDLEIIADVVRELANEVEWVFFGMCPETLKPYIHEFHSTVKLDAYPAKLASLNLDLALAPLEFHIFNDCKSNLRLLEYGACGYPVICTDTEAYRGSLPCTRVRSNGTQEWLEAIRMHLSDPAASYRMGDELREAVHRDFILRENNLQQWHWGWLAG